MISLSVGPTSGERAHSHTQQPDRGYSSRHTSGTSVGSPHGALTVWAFDEKCAVVESHDRVIAGRVSIWPSERLTVRPIDVLSRVMALSNTGLQRPHATDGYLIAIWSKVDGHLEVFRDPLGLEAGYFSFADGHIHISSTLQRLRSGRDWEPDFFREFIATGGTVAALTPYRGVFRIPAGARISYRGRDPEITQVWSPEHRQTQPIEEADAAAEFRRLFFQAVRRNIGDTGATWAQLSGGLDSSSVVCASAQLERTGAPRLGGALTVRCSEASGDDPRFVEDVSRHTSIRSISLDGWGPWTDDGDEPPDDHMPTRDYPYYARLRRISRQLRSEGCRWLLSGIGPDEYLPASSAHAWDLFWSGRWRSAFTEGLYWAMSMRDSIWNLAFQQLVLPSLPLAIEWRVRATALQPPAWLKPSSSDRHQIRRMLAYRLCRQWPRGAAHQGHVARSLTVVGAQIPDWWRMEGVEMRHPFLDLDLVDYILGVPALLRSDCDVPKKLLRRAMGSSLPASVRGRLAKGWITSGIAKSLDAERPRIERLVNRSILAEMGCVEPRELAEAVEKCSQGHTGRHLTMVYCALSLETWLWRQHGRQISLGEIGQRTAV